jgi:hypothetical protein
VVIDELVPVIESPNTVGDDAPVASVLHRLDRFDRPRRHPHPDQLSRQGCHD